MTPDTAIAKQDTGTVIAPLNQKALEKLKKGRVQLLMRQPFFGSLALRLDLIEDGVRVPTMGTDGKVLVYNPDFVNRLTPEEVIGVLCHEVLHCSNAHQARMGERNPMVWNYACDYAINPIIAAAKDEIGGVVPHPHLCDAQYEGWSAERIYDDLLSSGKCKVPQDGEGQGQGKGEGEKEGQGKPQDGQGNGQGQATDASGKPLEPSCGEVLPCRAGDETKEEQEWQVATRQAAQAAKMQGKLPASLAGVIAGMVEPKVDWKSILWEFVQTNVDKSDYTWHTPSHRYMARGLYLPTMHGEHCPPIAVTIDTSGSVSDNELRAFMSEIRCIVETVGPEKVYFMECDSKVQKCTIYERGDEFAPDHQMKVHGRGGTDFRPPFAYMDTHKFEDIACHIYLTDMEGPFPETAPDMPCLWIATTRNHTAPFGQTVPLEV